MLVHAHDLIAEIVRGPPQLVHGFAYRSGDRRQTFGSEQDKRNQEDNNQLAGTGRSRQEGKARRMAHEQ